MIHGTKLQALHSDPSGSVLRRWRPRQFAKTPAGVYMAHFDSQGSNSIPWSPFEVLEKACLNLQILQGIFGGIEIDQARGRG